MLTEQGDLVKGHYPIFCHQVNCKGVMGAGIAKQIKDKYPKVFNTYKKKCNAIKNPLGDYQWVYTNDGRICINMFSQDGYGRDKKYTDYEAFKKCLDDMAEVFNSLSCEVPFRAKYGNVIAFPYMIGCGNAGGDWNTVLALLQEFENKVGDAWLVNIVKLN